MLRPLLSRPALWLLPALLGACAAPPASAPQGADSRLAACQAEAERVVLRRERAQVMRADETESGRGFVTVAPYARAESDRAFAQMDRNRIISDCMGTGARAGGS